MNLREILDRINQNVMVVDGGVLWYRPMNLHPEDFGWMFRICKEYVENAEAQKGQTL